MLKLTALALGAALVATAASARPTLDVGQRITVSAVSVVGSAVTLNYPVTVNTTAGPIFLQTSIGGICSTPRCNLAYARLCEAA